MLCRFYWLLVMNQTTIVKRRATHLHTQNKLQQQLFNSEVERNVVKDNGGWACPMANSRERMEDKVEAAKSNFFVRKPKRIPNKKKEEEKGVK